MTHLLSQLPVSGIVDEEESEGAATTFVDKVSVSSTAFKKKNSAGLTFLDSIMCVSIVISKKKGSETYLPRGTYRKLPILPQNSASLIEFVLKFKLT